MGSPSSTKSAIRAHLQHLFTAGDDSDLTVFTASRHYSLHHLHVCRRSPVFLASCKFKNGHDLAPAPGLTSSNRPIATCGGCLDLSPDGQDPHAVHCLLQFLYLDDYIPASCLSDSESPNLTDKETIDPADTPDRGTVTHLLLLHVRVSALADCYDIPELGQLALNKFQNAVPPKIQPIEDIPGFLSVLREVYTSTKGSDIELRKVLARVFHEHEDQLLRLKEVDSLLLEYASLGRDILMQSTFGYNFHSSRRW